MSGDVQPRKRKDKKRKKDELGVEEPRGTAAALGEGDVFIHSQHDHGTGGHWCAKIIFFSLLAVLITLIGLIILENRGLSELEANSVESRYSGVLEGWLEDAPDDDHHDEHTLELNHPDEDEHDEEDDEDKEVEIERIEKEIDLEPISTELPALPEDDDDDDNDKSEELSTEEKAQEERDEDDGVAPEDLDDDFLEDDTDEPPIEHITAPVGKPLVEVEEDDSSEKPPDSLADEEEYEKQQEERKREEEQSSHMWLKLGVGGALLVATHALVRRATAPRDAPTEEERSEREETPLIDRRMTLIPEEPVPVPRISTPSYAPPVPQEKIIQRTPVITQQTSPPQDEEYEEDDEEKQTEDEEIEVVPSAQDTEDKELYSDEEVEENIEVKKEVPKLSASKPKEEVVEPEPEDEDPDDVEIIDEEQLEEEDEEEDDEEEISDVDDAELLSRLEAKYGRLPEPERPGQKPKDGGNSIEDEWPGEPSDAFWRQELDSAEEDLRRDWLD